MEAKRFKGTVKSLLLLNPAPGCSQNRKPDCIQHPASAKGLLYPQWLYPQRLVACVLFPLCLMLLSVSAIAEEFTVNHADTELVDKVYLLTANLDYKFSDEVLEAIDSGVAMVLLMELELYRTRDYIWDKQLATLQQRYRLQHHVLSGQYIVTNLNSGSILVYPSLYSATASIRSLKNIPVIDARLIEMEVPHVARLRASLELGALPVPLRLSAYFSRKWRIKSDWYEWSLVRFESLSSQKQDQEPEQVPEQETSQGPAQALSPEQPER